MARRSKKENRLLKFRVRIYIIVSISILIIVGILYFFLYSNFFKVSTVELDHSSFYERDQMLKDLSIEIVSSNGLSSLFTSKNILFWYFNRGDIEHPKRLPFLKNINIETDLARKKVSISVNENNLKGVICKNIDRCYGFNGEGTVYARSPYVEGSLILKISDRSNRPIVIGQKFLPDDEWINRIFDTISLLDREEIYFSEIFIKDLSLKEWGVSLSSENDLLFNFEFIPEDLGQVINNFFEQANQNDLDYIDFRVPGRIYYK